MSDGAGAASMNAIVRSRYGPPATLELREVDRPVPGAGQVVVRVRAASVNFADPLLVRGRPFLVRAATGLVRPRNPVIGQDLAGLVEAVGPNVTQHRPGDAVFGRGAGSFVEYALCRADQVVPIPPNVPFEQAAAVPLAGTTALQGVRDHGRVGPGQHVLIIGASGGVGSFAVQLAKSLEAEVTAVCSTRNLDLVRSIGADHVIDYTREDVTRGAARYDVILQFAGTRSPGRLRRLLKPRGTLVLSSGQGRLSGLDRIVKALLLSRFVRQRLVVFEERENAADLRYLGDLIASGKVTPAIDRAFPLSEAAAAIGYVESGHTSGKVVITV
jgi:NADPH:quinone reductase-like Zn-dependent oxidoreductase